MAAKQFTLTNTGAASGTIDTFTFNDPASIGHTANLANLGGGSAVTGNVTGLGYTLGVSSSIIFTVDYNDAGAGLGTYSGNIVIGGSGSTSQTITSTISVSSSTTTTTTTTTAGPTTTTTTAGPTTTTTTTTAAPGGLGFSPNIAISVTSSGTGGVASRVNLETTGLMTYEADGSTRTPNVYPGVAGPTQYLTPTGSGAAADYSARFLLSSVSESGGIPGSYDLFGSTYIGSPPAYTSWVPLTSQQYIAVLSGPPGEGGIQIEGTLYIRNNTTLTEISISVILNSAYA